MDLIGIVGRKRSGKDTLARFASEEWEDIDILSFADPLKQACKHAYNLKDHQLEKTKDVVDTRWGMTPREMMKSMGHEYFRSEDPDHWVKNMGFRVRGLKRVIISDVRYHNEARFIRESGGVLVHVKRETGGVCDDHPSERATDEIVCDYSIINDGTLEELREKFLSILRGSLKNGSLTSGS